MSLDAPSGVRRRLWPRLAVALILVAVVCLVIAWVVWPNGVMAVALFEVRMDAPSLVGSQPARQSSEQDYEILKKTQIALLKSKFVLTSALVNPGVAALSVFAGKGDPVVWLQDHLEIGFPQNGEILEIKLRGRKSEADDLLRIVDAVVEAYKKEVLSSEKSRQLAMRDMLACSVANLNTEIKRKYEDYLDIAKGMGRPDVENGEIQQQLMVKQLDRVDDELSQLERDLWKLSINNDSKDSKVIDATKQRLAELTKRRELLQKNLQLVIEKSVELVTRKRELDRLQKLENDMSVKLEQVDIDMEAPPRIRQLQPATIEPKQVAAGQLR
jgi:hypothetical protein